MYGSVRGAVSDGRPYRDNNAINSFDSRAATSKDARSVREHYLGFHARVIIVLSIDITERPGCRCNGREPHAEPRARPSFAARASKYSLRRMETGGIRLRLVRWGCQDTVWSHG